MNQAKAIQDQLKIKRTPTDVWTVKELLFLASSVKVKKGNWSKVSRLVKENVKALNDSSRPPDWFSPSNCSKQYQMLLDKVGTTKRKKRTASGNEKTESDLPGDIIIKELTELTIAELKREMAEIAERYHAKVDRLHDLVDDKLSEEEMAEWVKEIELRKKEKEKEEEAHLKWLQEREEAKKEAERKSRLYPHLPRTSSVSEVSSEAEADSPLSEPLNVDVPEESVIAKPTPTSPLLSSLLSKSPSHMLQRGAPPTIQNLLSSSPIKSTSLNLNTNTVSPQLTNLVSNAISGPFEELKPLIPVTPSPSQGAPTLSMLLELPPSERGKLHVLQTPPPPPPKTSAPPPYTASTKKEHLGPPPDYNQAKADLQKQKAAELQQIQQQQQLQQLTTPTKLPVNYTPIIDHALVSSFPLSTIVPSHPTMEIQTVETTVLASRQPSASSILDIPIILEDGNEITDVMKATTPTKRLHHNTSDHDYVESTMKEKKETTETESTVTDPMLESTPADDKTLDVFEFDEKKEGYDKFDLMIKDNKSYLKNKKDVEKDISPAKSNEPRSYLKASETKVKALDDKSPQKEVEEKKKSPKKIVEASPVKEYKNTHQKEKEGKPTAVKEKEVIKQAAPAAEVKQEVLPDESIQLDEKPSVDIQVEIPEEKLDLEAVEVITVPTEDTTASKDDEEEEEIKDEPTEESKIELEEDDSGSAREEEPLSHLADIIKNKKVELVPENENSMDTPIRSYSRKRPASFTHSDSVPSPAGVTSEDDRDRKSWKKTILIHWNRIAEHKYSSLFTKPITDDVAPNYSSKIKRPMDLSTIKRNLENGVIKTFDEFYRDVMLMFTNALVFNKPNSLVYQEARHMREDAIKYFKSLKGVQGTEENCSTRRETRTLDRSSKNRTSLSQAASVKKTLSKRKRSRGDSASDKKKEPDLEPKSNKVSRMQAGWPDD